MSKEAMTLALEALEMYCEHGAILRPLETRDAIKEALAKQEQGEPVVCERCKQLEEQAYDLLGQLKVANIKLAYTTPQPAQKPLTDEQIVLIIADCAASHQHLDIHLARAIEAAHGIKE